MKDELDKKFMKIFVGIRAKAQNYLIDDRSQDKKGKSSKRCVIKRKLKFGNDRNCLEATQLEIKINHLDKKLRQIVFKNIIKNL